MDLWYLKPGHKVRMRDGAEAEVLSKTEDGEWIKVRYLNGECDPLFAGTEDLAHRDEIGILLGVTHKSVWSEHVTVILHHIPENEESESGYEAVTMVGVPYRVSITGSYPDSAEGALNHLLNGLRAFGFRGRVAVEDATQPGPIERYEIDVDQPYQSQLLLDSRVPDVPIEVAPGNPGGLPRRLEGLGRAAQGCCI